MDCKIPIVITSSIQAKLDNPYGKSKKIAEDELIKYAEQNSVPVYVYRLLNAFGKWSRPNYNSVVSTFCYNISYNFNITVSDSKRELELVSIDDIIDEFVFLLNREAGDFHEHYYNIKRTFKVTLGELADKLYEIKEL